MQCHNSDFNGFFSCNSYFMPVEEEVCPLEDNIPEAVKIEKKKDNGITCLPGERLLIQLSKQRKKNQKINKLDVT